MRTPIYFERQRLMHCALHALNNLFQTNWLTKETLDALADMAAARRVSICPPASVMEWVSSQFEWMSFRTPVMGNYDRAVVELALKLAPVELGCFIVREGPLSAFSPDALNNMFLQNSRVRGLILHVLPKPARWPWSSVQRALRMDGAHWLAVAVPHACESLRELTCVQERLLLLDSAHEMAKPIGVNEISQTLDSFGYLTGPHDVHVFVIQEVQYQPAVQASSAPSPEQVTTEHLRSSDLADLLLESTATQHQLDLIHPEAEVRCPPRRTH